MAENSLNNKDIQKGKVTPINLKKKLVHYSSFFEQSIKIIGEIDTWSVAIDNRLCSEKNVSKCLSTFYILSSEKIIL